MVVTLDSTQFARQTYADSAGKKQKIGNSDAHIEAKEWENWVKKMEAEGKLTPDTMVTLHGQEYKWRHLKNMKGLIVDPATPPPASGEGKAAIDAQVTVVTHSHEVLAKIDREMADIKTQIDAAQKIKDEGTRKATLAGLKVKEKLLQQKKSKIQMQQGENLAKLVRMHRAKKVSGKAAWWTAAGKGVPPHLASKSAGKGGGVSASMTSGKAATANAPQQQKVAGNAKQSDGKATTSKGGNFGPASGWGGKAMTGPSFSAGAYAQSLFMEDNIMSSWDGINKSQNRGKELMQLLFYYMRMAMSGDLTAMYNMMKAVLYIISKDKALQQVHMANKLIQLQDQSRRQTDKLLNFNADQKDPNSQMQFTKLLQQVKSESDSTATSQKLIAQMMEEMAQIVETLTNVTKGALDAAGRVLRTVSRFT